MTTQISFDGIPVHPQNPRAQNLPKLRSQAVTAIRAGRSREAIQAYTALLALSTGTADDWYNLAYLHRCVHSFDAAIAAYGEALARHVAQPEAVHVNRAAIFSEHLADIPAAERELRQALAIAPDFVPALLNLAMIREDQGDRTDARFLYDAVIRIDPANGRAIARRAMLDLQKGVSPEIVTALAARLRDPGLASEDAGEIGFALGHALDAIGDYDAAFAAFAEANRAAAAPFIPYDPKAHEHLIDRIIAAFPQPVPRSGARDDAPVFVCGMFRSGSTLAEQIVARHPQVTAGGELAFLPQIVADHLVPFPQAAIGLGRDDIEALRTFYREKLRRVFPVYDVLTDKRPDNFLLIGLIKTMFPSARIVHTRRDAIDNALSIYFLNFDPSVGYGTDLASIGHYYRQYARLMRHWQALYPEDVHDLDYDRLVRSPDAEIRKLIAACGLPWDDRCLFPAPSEQVVRTPTTWQVRQPLHARSSGRWRNYDRHLSPLRTALAGE